MKDRCVKCLGPLEAGEFAVNKDMAYCGECAALLHLGESKESRTFRGFKEGLEAVPTPPPGEIAEAVEAEGIGGVEIADAVLEEGVS